MIRMIGKLKRNAGWLLLTLALLFVQAFCDLALPGYTSDIVDTGIQQKGVEDAVPKSIRPESLKSILTVAEGQDAKIIRDCYVQDGKLFYLRDLSKEQREDLSDIMGASELILSFAQEQGVDINTVPEEQIRAMKKGTEEKLKKYPESIVTQAAVLYVQTEYEAQGIDLNHLQRDYLIRTGAKMLGLALIGMVAAIIVTLLSSRIAAALARDLRQEVYRQVLSFSASEMNRFSTASLITRCTNDIQQVQNVMMMLFRIVVFAPVMATGALIKVARTGSYLRWILVVAVAAVAAMILLIFALAMPRFKKLQIKVDRINRIAREMLTGVPVIRAFSTEKHEEERFDEANTDFYRTNLFVSRLMSFMWPFMALIMNLVTVLTVYSGARGIDLGRLQVGDMMAFMQYAMHVIISFLFISSIAIFMPRASVSAGRIFEVLDMKSTIRDPLEPDIADSSLRGEIVFDDVTFAYPGAEETVLEHVSFTAREGETVAIIGGTGSGKSTLLNLIPRFYDVTEGTIRIDGVDIRDLALKDLRDRLGYIPQKAVLFSGTIAENLRFGREGAGEDELKAAVDIAQAGDFVYADNDGLEARIAQGGANISGGQKQRLSIARAIVKKPEFYLFDDSFSALDFKTDAAVRKRLGTECAGVTKLIVAQRVSTIMHADMILVLHDGKVIGKGTHEELMADCPTYQQIAHLQLRGGESA